MKVFIITKDKQELEFNVDPKQKFFEHNQMIYRLEPSSIRLSYKEGRINPTAELIFLENNPLPINSTLNPEDKKMFNDEIIIQDIIASSHAEPFGGIFGFLRNLFTMKGLKYIVIGGFIMYIAYMIVTKQLRFF